MAEYILELYLSESDHTAVARSVEQARRGAEEIAREGTPVTYLSSIFVPEDETCYVLYEATSAEAVREAARRAQLQFERIAEALTPVAGA